MSLSKQDAVDFIDFYERFRRVESKIHSDFNNAKGIVTTRRISTEEVYCLFMIEKENNESPFKLGTLVSFEAQEIIGEEVTSRRIVGRITNIDYNGKTAEVYHNELIYDSNFTVFPFLKLKYEQ